MLPDWLISLVLLAIVSITRCDLLDEYVRHVGESNQVNDDSHVHRRVRAKRNAKFLEEDAEWTHSAVLDFSGAVTLRWKPRHGEITFRVEARTRGYIGIGFSTNGDMEHADMIIGYVDDHTGRTHLTDYHGVNKSQGSAPVKDDNDNYILLHGSQNDTHTILEFRRALDTCDPHDYVLNGDTVRVIWALHDHDPSWPSELIYHGEKRGVQSLHLLAPPPLPKNDAPNHVRDWEVTLNNVEVKQDMKTMYWCKIFKAPSLQSKHHIVGYEPVIGLNHSNYVHHMLFHECNIDPTESTTWETYSQSEGAPCYSKEMPRRWENCQTTVIAWAVGSKGETYPSHVGLPLGERVQSYFMLEVHFDNPTMKRAVDTTGLRVRYTHKLRQQDAGVLVTGVALSALHVIPPLQQAYKSAGYCSFDCTKMLPSTGINVVSVLLHSHLAGRKLKLRHIRANKELLPLAEDNHYDFNYQQSRRLPEEITILPTDSLITECTYSTQGRKKPTLGGYSTTEEMCLAFVLHYPKTQLSGCFSMPPIKYFFETLGVSEFYGKKMNDIEKIFLDGINEVITPPTTKAPLFKYKPGDENSPEANARAIKALQNAKDFTIEGEGEHDNSGLSLLDQLIIKEPQEFQNKTFMAHLEDIPYHAVELTQKIEEYFYKGLHLTFCKRRNDTKEVKEKVEKLPDFQPYTSNNTLRCSYRSSYSSSSYAPAASYLLVIAVFLINMIIFRAPVVSSLGQPNASI